MNYKQLSPGQLSEDSILYLIYRLLCKAIRYETYRTCSVFGPCNRIQPVPRTFLDASVATLSIESLRTKFGGSRSRRKIRAGSGRDAFRFSVRFRWACAGDLPSPHPPPGLPSASEAVSLTQRPRRPFSRLPERYPSRSFRSFRSSRPDYNYSNRFDNYLTE